MKPKFIAYLTLITLGVSVFTYAVLFNFIEVEEKGWYWGAIIYYYVLGLIIGRITQKSATASNSTFFRGTLGATGIRMILTLLFLTIYLVISDIKAVPFIVFYLILYLLYTIFEMYQLVSKLRAEKQSSLDNSTS